MDHDAQEMTTTPSQPAATGPRVALVGMGTVGTAVADRLLDPAWGADVATRGLEVPRLVGIADLDLERDRGLTIPDDVRQTTEYQELLDADDVDIVIELMGGADIAADAVLAAFEAGKSVVTANKDLMARRGKDLETAARDADVALRFEAAVLSGVPVLGPLVGEMAATHITSVRGILNGTTNYILSTMAADAREYADVLGEAQARGYAESDPSSDVAGFDAAYKLVLLTRLAFGGWVDVETLRRRVPNVGTDDIDGIVGVKRSHMGVAARLGMALKLISRVERGTTEAVSGGVTLMAVAHGSPLGSTHGVTNVVEFDAEPVGRISMSGPGAGGPATSSAILADVLALSAGAGSTWGSLPPADALQVEDDLSGERGWLVVLEGLGEAGFPEAIKEVALATTDEGFVCRPMSAIALTSRLGPVDNRLAIYPVLSDA